MVKRTKIALVRMDKNRIICLQEIEFQHIVLFLYEETNNRKTLYIKGPFLHELVQVFKVMIGRYSPTEVTFFTRKRQDINFSAVGRTCLMPLFCAVSELLGSSLGPKPQVWLLLFGAATGEVGK